MDESDENSLPAEEFPPEWLDEFERARAAGKALMESPFAVMSAKYLDPPEHRLVLTLQNGVVVSIPLGLLEELEGAPPCALRKVEIPELRDAVEWEELDVQISSDGLLADMVGAIDARAAGRAGGSKKSPRKAAASRENGKKGGRPRKSPKK